MTGRRIALVVAVDQYESPALHELAAPAVDAEALAEVLGAAELGGFDVDVLSNPTSAAISQEVEGLLADRQPSDLVLLHFSCHGIKDASGELYLAATNSAPDRLASTAVEAAWVNRRMQRSRAQSIVLLLDCCYGGAFERGVVARAAGEIDVGDQFGQGALGHGRGRAVITASTAMEYALEGSLVTDGAPTPSIFTGALAEGIRSGDADRNQDGQISISELYDYVYDRVREHSPNQTPSKWEFGLRGELYIARNPHRRITPGPLPSELLEMIEHPTSGVRRAAVEELAKLSTGTNLPRAAAARLALVDLAHDDSRRVSQSAEEALESTAVRLRPSVVNFGRVRQESSPLVREAAVEGGPLALASTVTSSTTKLGALLEAGTLRISWTPDEPGGFDDMVTLSGPAGTAELRVTGEVAAAIAPPTRPSSFWGRNRIRWVGGLAATIATIAMVLAVVQPWVDGAEGGDSGANTPPPPPAACDFADEFTGDSVDPAWEQVRSDGGFVVAGGSIEVNAPDGSDIYETELAAPMLLRVPTGGFVLETEVIASPSQFYQGAGLVLWNGSMSYVRLERGFGDAGAIIFEYRDGGPHVKVNPPDSTSPSVILTDSPRVFLQLTKTERDVRASWRPVEDPIWREIGRIEIALPAFTKAGIAVLNRAQNTATPAPFSARFEYVRSACI